MRLIITNLKPYLNNCTLQVNFVGHLELDIGLYRWSTIDYPVSAKVLVKRPPCGQVPTGVAVSKLPKLSHHVEHDKKEGMQVHLDSAFQHVDCFCVVYTMQCQHLLHQWKLRVQQKGLVVMRANMCL